MRQDKLLRFTGSLLVVIIALGIFFYLMSTEMPQGNKELLISFVSVLFGAMASSFKQITGVDSQELEAVHNENIELKEKLRLSDDRIALLEQQVQQLINKVSL